MHPTSRSKFVITAAALVAAITSAHVASAALGDRPVSEPRATAPLQGGSAAQETAPEKSTFDKLWDIPTIYKNKDSDFLNELRVVGRFHLDQYNLDSDLGHDSDWIVRRLRAGIKAELFHHLTAHVEVDFSPQLDNPAYQRLTDAYLAWKFSPEFTLTVGKQRAKFTLDGSISSTELLTIDRSNVANNMWFPDEYIPGVTVSGNVGQWVYNVGVFSGGTASKEFGNLDAGEFVLGSVGYDFAKQFGVKKALLRLDYLHNERNRESTFTRSLENVGALVFVFDNTRWGFGADVVRATGFAGQGDL